MRLIDGKGSGQVTAEVTKFKIFHGDEDRFLIFEPSKDFHEKV